MKYTRMNAIVKGTTCDGRPFVDEVKFTLIPPKENELHYGTGCYLKVEVNSNIETFVSKNTQLYDVRYERTTDIEILADRVMESYYGRNAEEISKEFVEE